MVVREGFVPLPLASEDVKADTAVAAGEEELAPRPHPLPPPPPPLSLLFRFTAICVGSCLPALPLPLPVLMETLLPPLPPPLPPLPLLLLLRRLVLRREEFIIVKARKFRITVMKNL